METVKITRILSLLVVAIGAIALLGWIFELEPLKRVHPALVTMKANTALCLMSVGLAVALLADRRPSRGARRTVFGLALTVATVGVLTFVEHLCGWDFGIDELLFKESVMEAGQSFPGRMGPASALNFVLLAAGLLTLDWQIGRRQRWPAQFCALAVGAITFLIFLGYFYGLNRGERSGLYTSIALHTVVGFLLLAGALLLARPERGIMKVLLARNAGGVIARRMLPAALLLPAMLGWAFSIGHDEGWFSEGLGTALVATSLTFLFTALVWWTARSLNRVEIARKAAEEGLRRSERQLSDFFDNAALGLHWVGPDGIVQRVNDTELQMLGYSREEYVGRHIAEFHEDRAVIDEILDRLTRGETLTDFPARMRCKDGTARDVLIHSSVYRDHGEFIHTRCFTRDVTALRIGERAHAQLAALVDSSDDAIVSKDLNGIVTSWNAAAQRLFGYSAEEMVGQPITTIIPPERHSEEAMILGKLRAGERVDHFESIRLTRDQRYVHVAITASPIRDSTGRIIGASKIARDITERKRMVAALEQQREWFKVTLSSIGDAVIATDAEGAVNFVNPVASRMTGWPVDEALGKPISEVFVVVNEKTREPVPNPVNTVLREGTVIALANHTTLIGRDGSEVAIEDSAAPIKSSDGKILGAVIVFHDETERRRAREAVAARVRFTTLRAEVSAALASGGSATTVLRKCVAAMRTQLETIAVTIWTADESDGKLQMQASAGGDRNGCAPGIDPRELRLSDIVETGEPVLKTDVGRGGNNRGVITFAGYPLMLEGKALGVLAIFSHAMISMDAQGELARIADALAQWIRRMRADEALRVARDAAEAANRAKDKFLAALSHELRTPLTPVLMLAGAMERAPELSNALRDDFAMIRKNIELEARIIDDLLDLTRITEGKLALRFGDVDPRLLIEHTLAILRNELDAKQITVAFDLATPSPHVSADAVRLQQVFWNILKNAAKFTPQFGRITISSRTIDNLLRIAISDTGLGITSEELPRIFDAFTQGQEASEPRFGGLGLGLSISALLVREHGGRLWAESEGRGRGATFSIELPLLPAGAPVSRGDAAPAASSSERLRILLVEDHPASRDTLARLLRSRGHEVVTAESIASAQAAAQNAPADLVISDLGLPDGDGCDLMRTLRREFKIPGIALSGYGMKSDIKKSMEAGFGVHMTKPVNVFDLERAMQELISEKKLS